MYVFCLGQTSGPVDGNIAFSAVQSSCTVRTLRSDIHGAGGQSTIIAAVVVPIRFGTILCIIGLPGPPELHGIAGV
jgi:hypothetical protein